MLCFLKQLHWCISQLLFNVFSIPHLFSHFFFRSTTAQIAMKSVSWIVPCDELENHMNCKNKLTWQSTSSKLVIIFKPNMSLYKNRRCAYVAQGCWLRSVCQLAFQALATDLAVMYFANKCLKTCCVSKVDGCGCWSYPFE